MGKTIRDNNKGMDKCSTSLRTSGSFNTALLWRLASDLCSGEALHMCCGISGPMNKVVDSEIGSESQVY